MYYHATNINLPIGDQLRTKTGRSDGDILNGGAVFLTSDIDSCKRYGSFVFEIAAENAKPYKAALKEVGRSKKPRYTRNVFIAHPNETKIKRRVI